MNVLIVGCGVYAMGLATLLKKNNSIFMWVHDKELISNLKEQYASLNISYVTDLESTLKEMDCVIIAVVLFLKILRSLFILELKECLLMEHFLVN